MSARYTEAAVQVSCQVSWFKLKGCDWKIRSTKVNAGDFKHELLNQSRSTMAVNVLKKKSLMWRPTPSPSVYNLKSVTQLCTGFSWNSVEVFFTEQM